MSDLLKGLNSAQLAAVTFRDGPLLVLAGPGSGKTRVITHRVAYLIREVGVPPDRILAVTFTNKAAAEMRHRLDALIRGERIWACTFHSFCARLLRRYADRVGRTSRFSILDQSEREKTMLTVMKEVEIDSVHVPASGACHKISRLKNDLIGPEEFERQAGDYHDRVVAQVYPRYQKRLERMNALDFDDLLHLLADLLRNDQEIRSRLDERFQYVLVDEYQDTNLAQYAIARALSIDHPNLCATGDPDQSIYGWRGADLNNILNFEEDFPGAAVIRLEQNYRSTGHILAVADELIRHNSLRKHKELVTANPLGRKVTVYCHKDDFSEAHNIAELIRGAVDTGERQYRDFVVFIRVSSLSRAAESAFKARYIPYQVVGGYSFFERQEIRDVLAYARLVLNPRDDSAFLRVVNRPPRGIGKTTLDRLIRHANKMGTPLAEACRDAESIVGVRRKQSVALRDFRLLLDELSPISQLPPSDALEAIVDRTEYRKLFEEGDDEEQLGRLGNIEDMIAGAMSFSNENPEADFSEFLETVCLASDIDQLDDASDIVTIMTLHAAKGLEFPVVFLIGLEHNILPHERAVAEGNEEEERRLAFVGITRAKEELYLSYTTRRSYQGRTTYPAPSPFLLELPAESLRREDVVSNWGCMDPFSSDESQESAFEEQSIQVTRGAGEPSISDRFQRGMLVEHPRYGQGQILQLEGIGDGRKATVQFPTIGTKRFVLSKSPLQPL